MRLSECQPAKMVMSPVSLTTHFIHPYYYLGTSVDSVVDKLDQLHQFCLISGLVLHVSEHHVSNEEAQLCLLPTKVLVDGDYHHRLVNQNHGIVQETVAVFIAFVVSRHEYNHHLWAMQVYTV